MDESKKYKEHTQALGIVYNSRFDHLQNKIII